MMPESKQSSEVVTLAGGCFWCLQPVFQELRGVEKVEVGYSGGRLANPSYEAVCTDTTGHAEAVQVTFDPSVIPLADILRIFFSVHDPTTSNRQGGAVGTQYRSAIFYNSPEQENYRRSQTDTASRRRRLVDSTSSGRGPRRRSVRYPRAE